MVCQSLALQRVLDVVSRATPAVATVLLVGESGTGKEMTARLVHQLSDRPRGPWVAVNCAALPESLLETELFGHEKGAFTGAASQRAGRFERAHGGTIFLDEIGETSAAVQVRLLRVLQEGEIERVGGQDQVRIDVRVVAATHRNLEEDVAAGRFREDLYYRLNVIQIRVPPLRERRGDVPLLAQHFLRQFCDKNRKTIRGFSDGAIKALDSYAWPGNVRELENSIERAVVLCRSDVVGVDDLPEAVRAALGNAERPSAPGDGMYVPFGMPLEEVERHVIRETLDRTGGDKKTTARLLGIAARTIYRKMDIVPTELPPASSEH